MAKKIARILLWVFAILILLIGTTFVLLQVESVQTFLAQRAAAYLSDHLKTKVTIGRVSIRFFEKVLLKNVYIEDLHHNTLLYADELLVTIKDLKTSQHSMELSTVKLSHAKFNLMRYHGENFDNVHFLSDYFSSNDTTPSASPWKIKLNDINLVDVSFRHQVEDKVVYNDGVDFSNLDVTGIYGDLRNISFVNDSIFVNIDKLRFRDKSGFQLKELSTDAKVSPVEMRLKQLVIRTPDTDLHTDLTFRYDSMSAFDDFLTRVNFNSNFVKSTVSFNDIAYFASDLKNVNQSVKLDGEFKGTVSRFKGKNITIEFGEHSYYKGNVSMTGLPVIGETYLDATAKDVHVTVKDVEKIPVPPFDKHEHIVIPENLTALGTVNFEGKFTGFFNDFVAFGNINTDIGFVSSDMNVKVDPHNHTTQYSGHISTNHFNLGKIILSDDVGNLTMSADVKGSGFKIENMDATLNGNIDALEFRKYTYRGMKINGEVSKKLFSGSLAIHEPNIDLDFKGTVNLKQSIPEFNFTADIGKAHLDTLNLFNYRGEEELKTKILSHFSGNKLDNLDGTIELQNTDFRFDKVLYHMNDILVNSVSTNTNRSISIRSDNVDADFTGSIEFATLLSSFKQIVPRYLPAVVLPDKPVASRQDFSFNIALKNMSVVTENFFPSWWVEPNTMISGRFNSSTDDFLLNIESPLIKFKNFRFVNARLNNTTDREKMKLSLSADQLYYSDSSYIPFSQLHSEVAGNKVSFVLQMADSATYSERANLKGEFNFASAKKFDLHFGESSIILQHDKWLVSAENKIEFDTSSIKVTNLTFAKDNEQVNFGGIISENEKDLFSIDFNSFDLKHLNPLVASSKITLGGTLNGNATVSDVYRKIKLASNLEINQIQFNGDTLGNAVFNTSFDNDKKVISVNATIQNAAVKTVVLTGEYYTNEEKNNFNFDLKLTNFYLATIAKYIENTVSELSGRMSANLKLTGSFKEPVFTGNLNLNRVRCKVNYLNTRYNFTNDIAIGENYFELKDFKIFDEKGESAIANGRISHSFFKDFKFNVNLDAKKFQCLNTVASQNSIYYGIANASGSANFSGPLEDMSMQIQFKSEKGTQISIPLSSESELSQSNFITFREKGKFTSFSSLTNRINLSGIKLDMSLEVTPDAEIQLIFDEKIGDKIIGNGYGNLRLDINSIGDFNMYGTYEIQSGSYLFTLQNIINKKFTIESGSTISWGGNPYDADIDLGAVYTTKTATLYKILPDSSYRTSLYVDCRLHLSNKLMNPTIKYSIDVRGVDASAESQIKSVLNSEAEISKQMFGLLVLNQFIPASNTSQSNRIDAGAGAGASGIEFLSDQVNNWLSQISPEVNIGLNYKAKDNYSPEEYKVIFSKTLADDKLIIEGDVGVVGPSAAQQSANNFVGDFDIQYKLGQGDRFRIKFFNRSNTSNLVYNYAPYTQGIGITYKKEFNTLRELFNRSRSIKKKSTVENPAPVN